MNLDQFFERAWKDYLETTPKARQIKELLEAEGETVTNDHIALRTFSHPKCGVDKLAAYFLAQGYAEKEDYDFPEKKLAAKHYEKEGFPKIFISELLYKNFSSEFQRIIEEKIATIPDGNFDFYGEKKPWQTSSDEYEILAAESEYGSWMCAIGFKPNHFTVNVNTLSKYGSIAKVNQFLKDKGFELNSSGGEIKGSPEVYLEQSSIKADQAEVIFSDGPKMIPTCYYEFAYRYPLKEGGLYQGFVAKSADKIFESTDR